MTRATLSAALEQLLQVRHHGLAVRGAGKRTQEVLGAHANGRECDRLAVVDELLASLQVDGLLQTGDLVEDLPCLGIGIRAEVDILHDFPARSVELGEHELVEAGERGRWHSVGGRVLADGSDVGATPLLSHACKNIEANTTGHDITVDNGLSNGHDGADQGLENTLVGTAYEDAAKIVDQDHLNKGHVLAAKLLQLDLVIRPVDRLRKTGKYTLEEGGEEEVEDVIDLALEVVDNLLQEAKEERHLILTRALRKKSFNPLGQLWEDGNPEDTK